MKRIEFYLNIFHFCFYKLDYKLHLLFNKINPFWLLTKLSFFKRRYKELGVDIHKEINNVFENKVYGFSVTVAGGAILGILSIFFFSIYIIFIGLLGEKLKLSMVNFSIILFLSGIVCYLFVFKKDMYLDYFDKFEKWSKSEIRKYNWLTFIFVAIVAGLFILSFKFL